MSKKSIQLFYLFFDLTKKIILFVNFNLTNLQIRKKFKEKSQILPNSIPLFSTIMLQIY